MQRYETSRFKDLKGDTMHPFPFVSSFGEYTVVEMANLAKVDPAVPPSRACLLSCGVAAGVGAAWKTADVQAGSTVAIFGLGSIGLAVIVEMTNGGADYCFECADMASVMHEACASCRKGWGKTIVLGVDQSASKLTLDSFEVLLSQKILTGALFGGLKANSDIPILLKRYKDKELQMDKFFTHEVKFEEINKAFDLLIEGKSVRCVISTDK